MNRWFYAVLIESSGWYSVAVKAQDLDSAKVTLARKYPHATIHEIERGEIA